jgi:hypothetical protein
MTMTVITDDYIHAVCREAIDTDKFKSVSAHSRVSYLFSRVLQILARSTVCENSKMTSRPRALWDLSHSEIVNVIT